MQRLVNCRRCKHIHFLPHLALYYCSSLRLLLFSNFSVYQHTWRNARRFRGKQPELHLYTMCPPSSSHRDRKPGQVRHDSFVHENCCIDLVYIPQPAMQGRNYLLQNPCRLLLPPVHQFLTPVITWPFPNYVHNNPFLIISVVDGGPSSCRRNSRKNKKQKRKNFYLPCLAPV